MSLHWMREFPASYQVPRELTKLVRVGQLEDMSWRNDGCPSLGARLKSRAFVRVWVEHPDPTRRAVWIARFTVVVQPDPTVSFGWKAFSTEDAEAASEAVRGLLRATRTHVSLRILQPVAGVV